MSVSDTNFSIDSIYFFSCSRKRRSSDSLEFRAEHIIIISIDSVNEGTEIEFLVLDPRSTSLLPAKAFTPEALKTVILEMVLPYSTVPTTVDCCTTTPESNYPTGDNDGVSIVPIIGAVVVLIALVLAVWFYCRRRKNKRYIFLLQA